MKKIKNLFIFIICSLLMISCSSKNDFETYTEESSLKAEQNMNSYDSTGEDIEEQYAPAEMEEGYGVSDSKKSSQDRKVIINGFIRMESQNFDDDINNIKNYTEESGGYIDNLSTSFNNNGNYKYRESRIVLKIPADKYEEVRKQIYDLATVLEFNEYEEDKTSEYMDIQSYLEIKKEEESRLLSFLDSAEKVEDIIEIEKRLGEVRTSIEVYESQIKNIDRLSSHSTLEIRIKEVFGESINLPEGFPKKISDAFKSSINFTISVFEWIVIAISASVIPIIIIVIVGFIGFRIYRKFKKKNNK